MKTNARRIVSWIAAMTLLLTCAISGLVLPATAEEENLFVNGDFESGATAEWQSSALIVSGAGKDGGYGYYHDRTQSDEWAADGQIRYKAALLGKMEANTEYVLTFDYKTSGAARGQLYFDQTFGTTSDAKKLYSGYDLPLDVTNWTTQSIKFTTPAEIAANAGWEFSIRTRGGVGEVWYDNFVLTKAGAAEPPKFEMPDPTFSGEHGWTYNSTVEGLFTKGDAVPAQTDTDGNKYITVPANGKYVRSPAVAYDLKAGDWIRIEFKMRKNDAGKATLAMQLQGGMFDGYAQPEWTIEDAATGTTGNGEWFTYVTYAQAQKATSAFYVVPFLLTNKTTADLTVDIDDFEITALPAGTTKYDFELLDGSGFDEKPSALNDYGFGGLFNDGGKIVDDPADAENNVLYFDGTGNVQAYFYPINYSYVPEGTTSKKNVRTEANTIYKLTYRQRGTGTTSPGIGSTYGTRLSLTGEPDKASDEWKTITAYYKTSSSLNANYTFDFKVFGEVYLDDFSLKMVQPATSVELDKTAATVTEGDTLKLTTTVKPDGATADAIVWTTSDDTVATVVDGVVTAVKAGTATITATSGTLSATCTVTVEAAVNPGPGTDPEEPDSDALVDEKFENGPQGVFAGATDTSTSWNIVDGGVNGGKALAITYKNGDRWFKWNTLTFEPNTRYSITFLAKGPQVRLGVYKYSGSVDAKGGSFNLYTRPYQDDWTSYRLEFTTGAEGFGYDPANAGYGMFFNRASALADTTEVTLIDNFKIAKTDETTDRIIGGDFTYPGMQQWYGKHLNNTADGYIVVADPDDATNKVLKVPASTGNLGDNYLSGIYLEAGRLYELSFKAKGAPISVFMPAKQTSGGTLTGDAWFHTEESSDWKTYTYTFTATDNAAGYAEANWILNLSRNVDVTGDSYIDDFSIKLTTIPDATAVTLNKTETLLGINATETLTFTTTPTGAKYDSVSWKSSDETVATVVDGVVTGKATGTATITLTVMVGDTALTATCTVKVVVKAESFEIVQDSLHLAPATNSNRLWVYETIDLVTVPADADISGLTWKSSDETVVTVDAKGQVKALAAGTTTITVTDGTLSDSITVTVDAFGERVTGGDFEGDDWNVTYWTSSIIKDGSCSLVADPENPDNTVLMVPAQSQAKWMWPAHVDAGVVYKLTMKVKSANGVAMLHITPSYVQGNSDSGWASKTISAEGWTEVSYIIHTVSTGLNRNYLYGFGTNLGTVPMFVDDVSMVQLPDATSIALEDTSIGVKGSKDLALTTTPAESNVPALTWESSDPSIISVDQSGKITAVAGEGSVTITAKNADGSLTASCTVTIAGDPATAIKLNMDTHYAKKNSTLQLTMSTTPVNALYKKPVWTSSDETIATVDQNGLVTILDKEGETTITVTSGELTATCKVVVPGAAQSFELKDETIKLAPQRGSNTITKTLAIVTTPPNSTAGDLVWTSSNEAVATVDANGKVTALTEGETTITVKNADGSITDTCVVTVAWDGERIPGGDFESGDWNVKTWSSIIKDGKGYVITDPDDMDNLVLAFPRDNNALDALWMNNMHVNAGKTYKLTFKVKSEGENAAQFAAYFHPTSCNLNGWKYTSNLTNEWTEVSYVFTTNALDDGTSAALNRNYIFGIDNNKDDIVYLDDFSMVELPEATSITIGTSDEMTIRPEGTATLNVRTEPAEASAGKLTWESSDPTIISVDANGKIAVVGAEGSVTITVTNDKGLSDTIKVTIDDYAELLENGDFEMGDTYWPSHSVIKPGVGMDGSYGMILDNGNSKQDNFYKGTLPLQPGTTYIVEWDYKAAFESEFRLWGGKIGVSLYADTKNPGEWKHGKEVFTTPSNMEEINNATLKGWIFSVTSDKGGVEDKAVVDNISIKLYASGVEAESIKLNKETLTMMPGRTENLAIMATPVDGDVNRSKWYSSDENVATVEYGIVTAVGKGTATITAETLGGLKATCTVTVAGEPAFITNGTFEDAEDDAWILGGGASITDKTGVQNTHSGTLTTAETDVLSQKVTGLKPETTYQLFVRYRGAAAGKMAISLVNGEELALFEKAVDVTASWTKATYEFTTPAELDEESILSFVKTSGSGAIYIDNVFLSQKASMIDLVVENLIWDGGNEQVKPGTELTFFVMIKNQGDDPVKYGSVIDTDICVDGKPVQTISYLVTADMTTGTSVLVAGTAPWAAVEGDHVISARVNSTMSVLEFDPTNNNRFQTDLRVNDVFLEIPDVAANAGFDTLGFSDDFNNIGLIDSGDTRADGYKWYVSRPYGTASVTADSYFIKDGVLTLVDTLPTYNMSLTTAEYNSGIGFSYNQGYMEVRIRIPRPRENQAGETGIPAIWSLPIDKLQGHEDANWVEMDWLEYWGFDGGNKPEGYYTITLHDQDAVNSPNPYYNKNSNYSKRGLGDGEWHTMGWLWVQNAVVAYLDGEEVFRLHYDPEGFSDPMASVVSPGDKGGLGAFSYMNEQWLPVHISGSADNPMEMDYIRIWTSTGGGSIDIPSGDEDVVIDMAAEDFWYNYCTDDWGDPIVEVTEENYHNVLGLDFVTGECGGVYIWQNLTDERRAEIDALLESLGQPSYDELLMEAMLILLGSDADVVVDMSAEDFWNNYCADGEGNPITELTEENCLKILNGIYVWEHLTDERRAEINALLESLGQPSYDELLMESLLIIFGGEFDGEEPGTDSPDTGEHTAMPAAVATAMLLSAAVLWISRKRKKTQA